MISACSVIAVLTSYNRKALTLQCLGALAASAQQASVQLSAILVDDRSTDGTAAAVRERFPWVEVVEGTGTLYWNRGMRLGFDLALRRHADYYLWINDDTHLVPGALASLLVQSRVLCTRESRPVIVVGATAEREGGTISYGGRVAPSRIKRFNYRLVWSATDPMPCDAIEGNCVLIPRQIASDVGNLDPVFEHAMGDTDYGLRAQRAGYKLFVAAGVAGYCSPNAMGGTYFDTSLPLRQRWKLMMSRKGLPVRSWLHFSRRHGGLMWPLYFAWPYVRVLASGLIGRK